MPYKAYKEHYYCKTEGCDNEIHVGTARAGSGLCKSCARRNYVKLNPYPNKTYHCKKCNKQILKVTALKEPGLCQSCQTKRRWKDKDYRNKLVKYHKENPNKYWLNKIRPDFRGDNNPSRKRDMVGRNSGSWKGGVTPLIILIRESSKYKLWRISVYERYNYQCQECGQIGRKLECHHIKRFRNIFDEFLAKYKHLSPIEDKETLTRLAFEYNDFWNIENGLVLCKSCHKKTKEYCGRKEE